MAHGCGWISDDNSSSSEGEEEEITHDIRAVINGRRPPIDLAYEDKLPYDHGFDGRSIYPWSLDGMNKQQIHKVLSLMVAAANAYTAKGYSAHQAFEAITGGRLFERKGSPPQINAWWAAIPDPTKEALKNSFAQNPDGTPALYIIEGK